jgi:type IV secretion system T-DNA border endonuclease VirD2
VWGTTTSGVRREGNEPLAADLRAYREAANALEAAGTSEDRTLAGDLRGWLAKHLGMNATPEVFAARHAEAMSRGLHSPEVDSPDLPPHDLGRTR